MDHEQLFRAYATRLVHAIVPPELGDAYAASAASEVCARAAPRAGEAVSPAAVMERLRPRFAPQEWDRFEAAAAALARQQPQKVGSYLAFLEGLAPAAPAAPSAVQNAASSPWAASAANNAAPPRVASAGENATSPWPASVARPQTHAFASPGGGGGGPSVTFGGAAAASATPAGPAAPPAPGTLATAITCFYTTLDEPAILTYLGYTMLGTDSKVFAFSRAPEGWSVALPSSINHSYASLLKQILEPALIYKTMAEEAAEVPSGVAAAGGAAATAIHVALSQGIAQHLAAYTTAVNRIFGAPRSLLAVHADVAPLAAQLRLLFTAWRCRDMPAAPLLGRLHTLAQFGDATVAATAASLFDAAAAPFYAALWQWLLRGHLSDTAAGFFFVSYHAGGALNELVAFAPSRVPPFVDGAVARRAFEVGKLVIFLGQYCHELAWVNEYAHRNEVPPNDLAATVDTLYSQAAAHFSHLVRQRYRLAQHLANYKRFLLTGAHDFVEALITSGGAVLSQPANTLTASQLAQVLSRAIATSSARYMEPDFQARLDARLLNLGRDGQATANGTVGWEAFTLEYRIDEPLEQILQGGLVGYLRLFNFLWKVRNMEHLLSQGFCESSRLVRTDLLVLWRHARRARAAAAPAAGLRDRKVRWIVRSFNAVCLVRHEMTKFFSTLTRYLAVDVMEAAYDACVAALDGGAEQHVTAPAPAFMASLGLAAPAPAAPALTIESLTAAHSAYINRMVNCKLLSAAAPSGQLYIDQLYNFLDITFQFAKGAEAFESGLAKYVSLLNVESELRGDAAVDFDDDMAALEESLAAMAQRLRHQLYFSEFKPQLAAFARDLRATLELRELGKRFASVY
ncbi:Uncharacterized protein ABC855_g3763 [[Candida] zeylanoides]